MIYDLLKPRDDLDLILKKGQLANKLKIIELELERFKRSTKRKEMISGDRYYRYKHDILDRKREVIGEGGALQEVHNLPNNHVIDNQYELAVDKKVSYLLGKPVVYDTIDEDYAKALKDVLGRRFQRVLKSVGVDSLNSGLSWLYVYYDDTGALMFKKFNAYEVLPFWSDSEHSDLDMLVRMYEVEAYNDGRYEVIEKIEVYEVGGVEYYLMQNGKLVPDLDKKPSSYIVYEDNAGVEAYNWGRIPVIPFKYNDKEIPLIRKVKSLQDAINLIMSDFQNNMEENAGNTIIVLKNYDGQDLGEFRKNLATYRAVKVRSEQGASGGIDTLHVEVNAENYRSILQTLKKALIENAKSFDSKDDRMLGGSPNQMNIQSMYSDIDLDANNMETEYQAAFEELLWFVNMHLANTGVGEFDAADVTVQFDRDMLMNEGEIINNARQSMGVISHETVVKNHSWVTNAEEEMKRIDAELSQQMEIADAYGEPGAPVEHGAGGE